MVEFIQAIGWFLYQLVIVVAAIVGGAYAIKWLFTFILWMGLR